MEMFLDNKNIAIIGLGLLGTSLAMTLKGKCGKIIGWSRQESVTGEGVSVPGLQAQVG